MPARCRAAPGARRPQVRAPTGVVGRVGIHVHPVPFVQGTTIYGNSFVGFAGTLYEYVTTWGTKLLP